MQLCVHAPDRCANGFALELYNQGLQAAHLALHLRRGQEQPSSAATRDVVAARLSGPASRPSRALTCQRAFARK